MTIEDDINEIKQILSELDIGEEAESYLTQIIELLNVIDEYTAGRGDKE
jgi:hypothetical protein